MSNKLDGRTNAPYRFEHDGLAVALERTSQGERVLHIEATNGAELTGFAGALDGSGRLRGECSPVNAAALRARIPALNPVPLGVQTSFGFGDRMGSATPGHIAALRAVGVSGKAGEAQAIAPIFAQQSVRENARTLRTPQQVMDDALWGILEEGWNAAWGADADHVKQVSDLAPFMAAGYTFYTIDPSDHVDNQAQDADPAVLRDKVARLPWERFGASWAEMRTRYCLEPFALDGIVLAFDEVTLLRALAKYGRAIAHTMDVAAALTRQMGAGTYELEMSVDETETPTSVYEHFFIANELLAQSVPVVSLAPRFVGKFQKGVDYMGDLDLFAQELKGHVAIMDHFDAYKLSVHTGSDKFSLYAIVAEATRGRVHVKTAGTSYLEALRVVAAVDPALFRAMLDAARTCFERDRKSYFLDAELANVPADDALRDAELPALLDHFDTRQVLHVAFGTVLTTFGAPLHALINTHKDAFRAGLSHHFTRHLAPFVPEQAESKQRSLQET